MVLECVLSCTNDDDDDDECGDDDDDGDGGLIVVSLWPLGGLLVLVKFCYWGLGFRVNS